jgi:hypothetical protein
MIELNWDDFYFQPAELAEPIKIGSLSLVPHEILDFGDPVGKISVRDLISATALYRISPKPHTTPQLALLVFAATRRTAALNTYFPITKILDKTEQQDFYRTAAKMMQQKLFDVRVMAERLYYPSVTDMIPRELTARMPEVAYFVACQITEVFFYRRDLLQRLWSTPFKIRLYSTPKAFEEDGGVAGGNFSLQKSAIQLLLPRLYEGFYDKAPGVAPFLHEFGHLLDHFDLKQPGLSKSFGTLPGMRERDGALFNPQARKLFLKGKQLEWERYMHLHDNGYQEGDAMPIGHPYVFQNDGEFIAGYFEMFFRNPHTFAAQNLDLFDSFRLTFGYDPSKAWTEDFPYYIEQNQQFYREHKPPKPGLCPPPRPPPPW